MGGAIAWVAELEHTLPAAPLPGLSPAPPSPRARLVLAGRSWPPEVGEAGVLLPASPHTRIWYPLRSGMALGSEGFFSPEGLQRGESRGREG